ncbi:hypothetical protein [Phaeobacter inhibens]|nr:hypothetical protein [Phaeobacter inhibens]UWR83021.1 hypothetical protein K4L05_09660 [Phaeobacter inhibens]
MIHPENHSRPQATRITDPTGDNNSAIQPQGATDSTGGTPHQNRATGHS